MTFIRINEGTKDERVIGELHEKEGIFSKQVKMSKHLFRIKNAWGLDAQFFNDVLLPNKYFIQIYDLENKKYYCCESEVFKKYGFHYHFKNSDDHRAQIFLSLNHFNIIE